MSVLHRVPVAALLIAASSAACSGGASKAVEDPCPPIRERVLQPEGEGWYHGPIVMIDSTRAAGRGYRGWSRELLVQVQPEGHTTGRVWFGVSESTRLLCRSGASRPRSAPLAPGMTVSARTRMMLESDPGQALADTLIVDAVP